MQPTLAGFLGFIRGVMGISTDVLPDDSPVIPFALSLALAVVNKALRAVALPATDSAGASLNSGGWSLYALAVYNFAGDRLINYAQDATNAPKVDGSNPPMAFFAWARKQWNINSFVSGVISGSADLTTSQSLVVQEAAKFFTLSDLQQLKTPYGRTYLGLAQAFGPSTWGMS